MFLKKMAELNDAVKFYEKAIVLEPHFADAYNNIGIVLFETGQFDDAIKFYEKALEVEPSYAEAHNNLGNTLSKKLVNWIKLLRVMEVSTKV